MKLKRVLYVTGTLLLGLVFLFSGFVKAVDPWGTAYKMTDYLEAFHVDSLAFLSLPAAFLMIVYEFVLGFNLFFRLHAKLTWWGTVLFMLVMTPLTLYLALTNPVSDCGCFGDALVLTNWETFYKNIAIDAVLVLIWCCRSADEYRLPSANAWGLTGLAAVACLCLQVYSYRHLPILDFRPYKVGNSLPDLMEPGPNAKPDKYQTTFVYEKDGVSQEFALDSLPDSTWTFVSQQSVLLEKGDVPLIHDFFLELADRGDITEEVLENPGYTFLIISSKLECSDEQAWDGLNALYDYAQSRGVAFYGATASYHTEVQAFKQAHHILYPIVSTDEITLKTIIRSNPGVVLLRAGTVIGKWHYNDIPTEEYLNTIINP